MHAGIEIDAFVEHLIKENKVYSVLGNAFKGYMLPLISVPDAGQDVLRLNIVTSDASETINGGNYDDLIYSRGGDDTVSGKKGDDRIIGGLGNNLLHGNEGNDIVEGGGQLYGDDGDDAIYAVRAYDIFHGKNYGGVYEIPPPYAVSVIDGGDGWDTASIYTNSLKAPATVDLTKIENTLGGITIRSIEQASITALGAQVTLIGGSLGDAFKGSGTLDGGGGDDFLFGLGNVSGGDGNDLLVGAGNVSAGAGDDIVIGASSLVNPGYNDYHGGYGVYDGGDGFDTLILNFYYDAQAVNIDISGSGQLPGITSVSNFERIDIVGSTVADSLTGGDYSDTLRGGFGGDILSGEGSDDVLSGQSGDDKLFGGMGNDQLSGGNGIDFLNGGIGDDVMAGGYESDTYVVDSAGDTVSESQFGGKHDEIRTALSSYVLPENVEDLTYTGFGDFVGTGNSLDNKVLGGASSDYLAGADGADKLAGNAGKDFLTGGTGADLFVLKPGDSGPDTSDRDVMTDFEHGIDKIDLTALGAIDFTAQVTYEAAPGARSFMLTWTTTGSTPPILP